MPADTQRCAFPGGWAGIIGKHMAEDKNRWCIPFRISQWQRQWQDLPYQIPSPHLAAAHGCNCMFLLNSNEETASCWQVPMGSHWQR